MSDSLSLVYAIPCEKAIIARSNEQISIIGALESVEITVAPSAPDKFIYPIKWQVATLWKRNEDTRDVIAFEQKTVLNDREGDEIFSSIHGFETDPNFEYFRNVVDFPGMPIAESGPIELETYLRKTASEEWTKHRSYSIHIIRTVVQQEAQDVTPEPA